MNKASTIARTLLGVLFVVFAANFWLKFLEVPGPPEGAAAGFMGALYGSGFLLVIKVIELLGGLALIANRFTNLALVLLGAIIFVIGGYHVFMVKGGYPMVAVFVVLAVLTLLGQKGLMKTLFAAKG